MRLKRWLFTAVMCLGLVAVLGAVKFFQIRAAIAFGESFPEPSESVTTKLLEPVLWQASINVIGTARAQQELTLRNELGGLIQDVGFTSGSKVKRGDVLLQLDISSELAELSSITPEITRLKADVKRYADLSDIRAASRQQIEQVSANLAVAKARAKSIEATIVKKTIVAPFDGQAGLHLFEVGEYLAPNSVVTYLVGDTSELRVDFAMPQRYANLSVGTQVSVSDDQLTDVILTGLVSAVEPSISAISRTVNARAQLSNRDSILKAGSLLNVRVPVSEPQSVFILPSMAVRKDTFGDFVFRLERDKNNALRAQRQPVTVIVQQGRETVVGQGLELGMLVAVKGAFKLREGLLVYQSSELAEPSSESEAVIEKAQADVDNDAIIDKTPLETPSAEPIEASQ